MRGVIDHFSYSQLSCYLACPLRYRLKYVELIPPAFTSSALVFGRAVHEAIALFHEMRLVGDYLSPDEMLSKYREAWAAERNVEIRFCNGDSQEKLEDKARQLLDLYSDEFDYEVELVAIEQPFETSLCDSAPPFKGFIDLIVEANSGHVTIVDIKTAAKKPSATHLSGHLQLTGYGIAAAELGFDPSALQFRLDVLTKTKTPELVKCEVECTDEDRRRFIKLVTNVWHAIERETWFPRKDWHCQQCAWAEPCKKW